MLINENLALYNFESGETLEDKDSGYTYFDLGKLSELDLEDGETYTISFNLKQSAKGCGQFNAGPLSFTPKILLDRTPYEINDRSSFKFVYDQSKHSSLAVYTDLVSRAAGVGGTIKYVKIEKGDKMTPYIPNENAVETAKRQYFIGGGYVQRSISNLIKALLGRGMVYAD